MFIQIHLLSKIFNLRKMDRGKENVLWVSMLYLLPLLCLIEICLHAQLLSHVWFFVTPWTVAWQAPLLTGFSRQEYWSGLPCPPPWDLHDPGIELASLASPVLTGGFFFTNCATCFTLTWDSAVFSLPFCLFCSSSVVFNTYSNNLCIWIQIWTFTFLFNFFF